MHILLLLLFFVDKIIKAKLNNMYDPATKDLEFVAHPLRSHDLSSIQPVCPIKGDNRDQLSVASDMHNALRSSKITSNKLS
jgi:hypothetical protein